MYLELAGIEMVCDADEGERRLVVHPAHELALAQFLEGVHLVAVGQEEQLRQAVRALHVTVVQLAAVHEPQERLEEGRRRIVNFNSPKLGWILCQKVSDCVKIARWNNTPLDGFSHPRE